MYKTRSIVVVGVIIGLLSACASAVPVSEPQTTGGTSAKGQLVVYTGRSEPLIRPVLDAFKLKYPAVEILLKAGSNSEMANALIEEQANPQADVFVTTELFTAQSLASKGLFESYQSAEALKFPAGFNSADHAWTGLTRRARVIMYNKDLVAPNELPTSIFDLTDPKWKGKIAAAGSTNGSIQAQIAAMRLLIGESATEQWLQGLVTNDVTFFGGHTDVRKAVGAGEFALGLVNHYYYYLQLGEGSNVGVIFPDQKDGQIGLITNATAAAIIKGTDNLSAAQALIDFLVSAEGQKLFAETNYEYPLMAGIALQGSVQALEGMRLANVNIAQSAREFDATFHLMEKINLP